MGYKIIYKKGDADIGSAPWPDEEGAIRLARNQFPRRHKQNGATSVIVINMDAAAPDNIIFSMTEAEIEQ